MLRNTTLLHPGPPHCPGVVVGIVGASAVITVVGAPVVGAVVVKSGGPAFTGVMEWSVAITVTNL